MDRTATRGQSLVELVLITPILLLLFVIAGYIGLGMYQAQMASDAIRQPALKKWDMANEPGKITQNEVLGYANNGGPKGTAGRGLLDSVDFINVDPETSIIVGNKNFAISSIPLPEFNFTVAQAINRKLLRKASEGSARERPFDKNWIPSGDVRPIPWDDLAGDPHLPGTFEMLDNGCQTEDVDKEDQNVLQRYILPSETYIARTYTDEPSPVTQPTLMQIANTYGDECTKKQEANWNSVCAQEYQDLMPDSKSSISGSRTAGEQTGTYTYINPNGGPAMKEIYTIVCHETNPPCRIDPPGPPDYESLGFPPTHGLYWDDTGKYEKPPADFVKSCKASKEAMCRLETAAKKAKKIVQDYPVECEGFPYVP